MGFHPSTGICLHNSCFPDGHAILFFLADAVSRLVKTHKKSAVFRDLEIPLILCFYLVVKELFIPLYPLVSAIVTWALWVRQGKCFKIVTKNIFLLLHNVSTCFFSYIAYIVQEYHVLHLLIALIL